MTVATIRERAGADDVDVAFLESARFYKLLKDNPAFDEALRLLRDSMATGRPLTVGLASPGDSVIEEVGDAAT
jgi:hypothetical protein